MSFFLPTVSGLKYTHPSVYISLPGGKEGWAEPWPCNLRPDFHWKQMLSIRCKDRLMFSKAYNNKPRGLSHASWENRSKRPEYQLSVGERVSEYSGRWASGKELVCMASQGRGENHEKHSEEGKQGRIQKGEQMKYKSTKRVYAQKNCKILCVFLLQFFLSPITLSQGNLNTYQY